MTAAMTDQPTPPSFAALARLATEASTAIGAEIARRAEETRPAIEALTRQLAFDGEAMTRAFGAALRAAQPKPPPVPTIEHVLDVARRLADRPPLGQLEVGSLVHSAVKTRIAPSVSLGPAPLSALYGVPIVVPAGMDPDAWRLLDTDGHIIKDGTL